MKKINVAELLKNCPNGMELDCTMFDNAKFIGVENYDKPICIRIGNGDLYFHLTKFGTWNFDDDAKCVIFPKGKTTWEGFHRPFVEGDIVSTESGMYIGIVKFTEDSHWCDVFCSINDNEDFFIDNSFLFSRFATKEEKEKLFQAIKDNGYCWNDESKTLEKLIKPIFKVGDRIRRKTDTTTTKIIGYIYHDSYALYDGHLLLFKEQDQYELVPDKFDISKLKPFDKVLVRDFDNEVWDIDFFSKLLDGKHFKCHGSSYVQCIPYKGNEYLHNTTNACSHFYKTWEK